MKAAILFFISIILTAIFSYSLQFFLREDYAMLTLKTMLIPCFTWTVLIIAAYKDFTVSRFLEYASIAGLVCVSGSAILVPCGIYNFLSIKPDINYSVVSVLLSVMIMSILFYVLLLRNQFSIRWWWAYNILICINMTIFYLAAGK